MSEESSPAVLSDGDEGARSAEQAIAPRTGAGIGEWVVAAAVFGLAVVVLLDGLGQRQSTSASGIGAGFMPIVVGSLLADPAPLQDIDGTPVHITVLDQGAPLIDADINLIQLNEDGWLNPDPGLAGWYGPPQWQTVPGNLSGYRAVIVGHNVTGEGMKDVFFDLGRVKAGDSVVITYALRAGGVTTAQFAVAADAVSAPKQDVIAQATTAYRWVWQSDGPQRTLALFSCDLDAPHVDGHSVDNWIVTATRVS